MKRFNLRSKELKINGVINSPSLLRAFLIGKKMIIKGNSNSHPFGTPGTVMTINSIGTFGGGTGATYSTISTLNGVSGQIRFTDFVIKEEETVVDLKESVKLLIQDKRDIDVEISLLKDKIAFCKDNKLDKFDDEEFKSYRALTLLEDGSLTKLEKAKLLATLIKG